MEYCIGGGNSENFEKKVMTEPDVFCSFSSNISYKYTMGEYLSGIFTFELKGLNVSNKINHTGTSI